MYNSKIKYGKIAKSTLFNFICILISITCIFPILWLMYSSLKTKGEFIQNALSLPAIPQFQNYIKAFQYGNLATATMNSIINVIVNLIVVNIGAVISGYFFSRYKFKGKYLIYSFYLIGFLIPLYGLLVPVFVQYKLLDILDKRIALWLSYYAMQIPLSIFLVESFVKGIPFELEEAAAIAGCSLWKTIWKIIFPLCMPCIATVSILTALRTWNEFGFASVLIYKGALRTVPVAIMSYTSGKTYEFTYMMAALVCASLPIIILYMVFSKQIIKGVTVSAVKG